MRDMNDVAPLQAGRPKLLDERKLTDWMKRNVDGFAGPLTARMLAGGQSNPTYLLETSARSGSLALIEEGGQLLAEGTPEDVARVKESYTGQRLKEML